MASVIDELVWSTGVTILTGARHVKCLLTFKKNMMPLSSSLVITSRVPSVTSANITLTTTHFYAKWQ
jgi:hypothetical protein